MHIFLEAPSLLFLLLFRLTVISIGASGGSGSCSGFDFFLEEALVVGDAGVAGDDSEAEADAGAYVSSGISGVASSVAGLKSGAGAASGFFKGEVAAGLVSPVFFFFFGGGFFSSRSLRSSLRQP